MHSRRGHWTFLYSLVSRNDVNRTGVRLVYILVDSLHLG